MPKDGYICKSFTCTVVSKVLHFTSINWALLGEEKWKAKMNHREVILHNDALRNLTYNNVILEKLERDLRIIENAIKSLEEDCVQLEAKLEEVRISPESLVRVDR